MLSEYETGLLGSVDAVLGRHQTKKGNQWYFGMKAHFGVDSRTKLIHAAVATPANVADSTVLPELLHGHETRVWGDQAYRGQRGDPGSRAQGPRFHQSALPSPRHRGWGRAEGKRYHPESAAVGTGQAAADWGSDCFQCQGNSSCSLAAG